MTAGWRVLIVDDEDNVRRDIGKTLIGSGYDVTAVSGAPEALQELARTDFALVIIDIVMRDPLGIKSATAGLSLLRTMKERGLDVPVIMLTGRPDLDTLTEAVQEGISTYLEKDKLTDEKLLAEVHRGIQRKQPKQVVEEVVGQDPFQIPFSAFQRLDSKRVEELLARARREKRAWAEAKLKELGASWLVICGSKVVASSLDKSSIPSVSELEQIGVTENRIPILFRRPTDSEEAPASCRWAATCQGYPYPTLPVSLKSPGGQTSLTADFDTGSPFVHLSLEEVLSRHLLSIEDLIRYRRAGLYDPSQRHLGELYGAYAVDFELRIDARGVSDPWTRLDCLCVENWEASTFRSINPSRSALVGRVVLHDRPLKVVLDGKSRTTTVVPRAWHPSWRRRLHRLVRWRRQSP